MTKVKGFKQLLKDDVKCLHYARLDIRNIEGKIQRQKTKLSKYPEALKIIKLAEDLVKANKEESQLVVEVKDSALDYWTSDECNQKAGKKMSEFSYEKQASFYAE